MKSLLLVCEYLCEFVEIPVENFTKINFKPNEKTSYYSVGIVCKWTVFSQFLKENALIQCEWQMKQIVRTKKNYVDFVKQPAKASNSDEVFLLFRFHRLLYQWIDSKPHLS